MKLYYYTFTPKGEVLKEIITSRKNKYSFAVDSCTVYGGYEHKCASKLSRDSENKILGATSTASNGCYMYSTTISEITDEMKDFAKKRFENISKIIELENTLKSLAENFNFTEKIKNKIWYNFPLNPYYNIIGGRGDYGKEG